MRRIEHGFRHAGPIRSDALRGLESEGPLLGSHPIMDSAMPGPSAKTHLVVQGVNNSVRNARHGGWGVGEEETQQDVEDVVEEASPY